VILNTISDIRSKIFEIISGHHQSWIPSLDIAKALSLNLEEIVDPLQSLNNDGLIEVWVDSPCGVSWALTPYAAFSLGIKLDDHGQSWIPKKKSKITKNRPKPDTKLFSHLETENFYMEYTDTIDKKAFEAEQVVSAHEELVYELGGEEQFRKLQEFKRKGPKRLSFPPPRNLLGSNCTWPVDGQDRQEGPRTEYVTHPETCSNCGGSPGTFGYCLCCDSYGLDSLLPAISVFEDWKQVKEAIEARKARKKQRRERKNRKNVEVS